jgi:CBS domain-containing membrane protein
MAASAVLLYAAQHSPMAQPWALVGGHFTSALCGWLAVQWLHDPILVAAFAVGMSITGMSLLRCLHPPGAATALLIALNYPIFQPLGGAWLTYVVMLNVLMSLCAALLINAWILGKRYPDRHPHPTPIAHIDLQHALQQYPVAVSEEVLLELYRLAYQHARKSKKQGK